MKKLITLILCVSLLVTAQGNLAANKKQGATLKIETKDGQIKGELIAVKKDSLLLKDSWSGADVSIDITNIKVIRIVRGSQAAKGGGYGFLIGAVLGLISAEVNNNRLSWLYVGHFRAAAFFGSIGAIFGYAATELYEKIQIEGMADSWILYHLGELRKIARVPDYK